MIAPLRIEEILRCLNRHGVAYVVIGGVAVIAHGVPRATLDLDVVPSPEPDNDGRLAAALQELGASMSVDSEFRDLDLTDPFDVARARNIRVQTTAGTLDLVNAPEGLDSYESLAAAAIEVRILGVPARVADRERLIRMKLAAGHPRDLQDVADLTADEAAGPT